MNRWAIPAASLVTLEYIVAFAIGTCVGFHYAIPIASYLVAGLVVVTIGFAGFVMVRMVQARNSNIPLNISRFAPFAIGVLLVALQWAVVMWLKVMLPLSVGFWADPLLADADRALFGTDPWLTTHAVLSSAGPLIDRAYVTWAPVKFVILLCLLLAPESQLKVRALVSYFLFASVGSLSQFLLPSAGPIFYEAMGHGSRFAQLPIAPWVAEASQYLLAEYVQAGGRIGTGISAMPSIHVAAALWVALVVRSYNRRFAPIAFAWFSLILVGSVFLGWHYALDGIAACAITLIAWRSGAALERPPLAGAQIAPIKSATVS